MCSNEYVVRVSSAFSSTFKEKVAEKKENYERNQVLEQNVLKISPVQL